ncbi:ribosomal protein L7/L12 [Nannocystis pusilla]|uniref:ribosomal protein L7/L12 n=1 Tax=Nannocystis pusilla TaxID=889268 RepID=UPI003BF20F7A
MSERLDVVIVSDEGAAVHHQRWGATALFDMLLAGPEGAVAQARGFDRTEEISDVLAACVIDLVRRRLVVAGPAEVISAAGPRVVEPQDVLVALARSWSGWSLAYEPSFVLEPVVLYVRSLGLSLASSNEPHNLSDYLGRPRFVAPTYTLDVIVGESAPERLFTSGGDASDVILHSPGDSKIAVIKALRELSPMSLKEAKDLVESAPCTVRAAVPRQEARAIAARLRLAGAIVEIR